MLVNIVNNAKDAILENKPKDKKVVIKNIVNKDDKKVIITIQDFAGGIPKNIIDNIFDQYFSTKKDTHGTGIGLHMSYDIIVNHLKGKLYVRNQNGGACFYVELPL